MNFAVFQFLFLQRCPRNIIFCRAVCICCYGKLYAAIFRQINGFITICLVGSPASVVILSDSYFWILSCLLKPKGAILFNRVQLKTVFFSIRIILIVVFFRFIANLYNPCRCVLRQTELNKRLTSIIKFVAVDCFSIAIFNYHEKLLIYRYIFYCICISGIVLYCNCHTIRIFRTSEWAAVRRNLIASIYLLQFLIPQPHFFDAGSHFSLLCLICYIERLEAQRWSIRQARYIIGSIWFDAGNRWCLGILFDCHITFNTILLMCLCVPIKIIVSFFRSKVVKHPRVAGLTDIYMISPHIFGTCCRYTLMLWCFRSKGKLCRNYNFAVPLRIRKG